MKKLLLFTLLVFLCASCDFENGINKNPNLPSSAKPSQLIANAMLSLPALSASPLGEYYAQYLSQAAYVDQSLYPENTTSFYWLYEGPLINLQKAINLATNPNEKAVAEILKCYYFWNITDRWGDVPYSEALQGNKDFTPAYDTQKDIYYALFDTLEAAVNQLDGDAAINNDIIFNGNVEKWRKFGNSVRLLMALRLSNVDEQKASQEFADALSAGVMESNDDSFIFHNLNNSNVENYWYNQIIVQTRVWWAIPVRLIKMMKPTNDPRLAVYADKAEKTGDYTGLPFGTPDDQVGNVNQYSLLGSDIYEQDAPAYLLTYAEVEFAIAEAAARNWISENPKTHYNKAVRASVKQWTGSEAGARQLLQNQPYDPAHPIEQIATQRYIHLFMFGYEGWAEWRRTGYPDNMVNPNGRKVPRRLGYPSDEALNNTDNYNEALKRQFGGDNGIYGRVWWDVK